MDYNEIQYNAPNNEINNQAPNPNNGLAIASLVLGILSIILCCCISVLGIITGIPAIILAVLSKKSNGGKMSGLAIAGLICGIFGLVLSIVGFILSFIFSQSILEELRYYM